jgi:homoaconitase/3-isopropylmalate dehydratase large subunit
MANILGNQAPAKQQKNVEKIQEFIHEVHRQTIQKLTDTVATSYGVCHEILTENLNMRCTATKLFPDY